MPIDLGQLATLLANAGLNIAGAANTRGATGTAGQLGQQAATQSNTLLGGAQTRALGGISPFLNLGGPATTNLQNLMDPNGQFYQGFTGNTNLPTFSPPNPQDVLKNPSIAFQLGQGEQSILRNASATGTLGPATLKELNNYAQGVASTGYNNLFNQSQQAWQDQFTQAQQQFQNAFGVFQNTRNTNLGVLNTALGLGQTAAGENANINLSTAAQQGANLQGAANVQGAAGIAGANAVNSALGNIGSSIISMSDLNKILNKLPQTPPPPPPPGGYPGNVGPTLADANAPVTGTAPNLEALGPGAQGPTLADLGGVAGGVGGAGAAAAGAGVGAGAAGAGAGAGIVGSAGLPIGLDVGGGIGAAGAEVAAPAIAEGAGEAAAAGGEAAAGAASAGAGAGAGGGTLGAISGFLTNPITIGVGAALAGALIWKNSQVHPTADKFVQGYQNPFGQHLSKIVDGFDSALASGQFSKADAQTAYDQTSGLISKFMTDTANFSKQGGKQKIVANQAMRTMAQNFGGSQNPDGTWTPDWSKVLGKMQTEISGLT